MDEGDMLEKEQKLVEFMEKHIFYRLVNRRL